MRRPLSVVAVVVLVDCASAGDADATASARAPAGLNSAFMRFRSEFEDAEMLRGRSSRAYRSRCDIRVDALRRTVDPCVKRELLLLADGVAAQPVRKIHERGNAARLGAVAPVLQLAHQLLLGR